MTAAATILRDTIEIEWSLTGLLSKVVTGSGSTLMDKVVKFFDRAQVIGNQIPKAVVVEKINGETEENVINHPNFNEVSDLYLITVTYKVVGVEKSNFSTALDNVERMAAEVIRILKTVYNPSSNLGIYLRITKNWINEDIYEGSQPQLRRKLYFRLTTIVSNQPQTFSGFGGVLLFDTSASVADDLPVADYIYTEVENVKITEGYEQKEVYTKDKTRGKGIPLIRRGRFRGTFSAVMFAKGDDLTGDTIEKLDNIYKTQANPPLVNQNAEVVFLHTNQNTDFAGKVTIVYVTNGGNNYTSVPDVTFSGFGGGATATAIVANEKVVAIEIITPGSWSIEAPTVTITGGGGDGATAISTINKTLTTSSFMRINNIEKLSPEINLVKYAITGTLTKPTEYEVTT